MKEDSTQNDKALHNHTHQTTTGLPEPPSKESAKPALPSTRPVSISTSHATTTCPSPSALETRPSTAQLLRTGLSFGLTDINSGSILTTLGRRARFRFRKVCTSLFSGNAGNQMLTKRRDFELPWEELVGG